MPVPVVPPVTAGVAPTYTVADLTADLEVRATWRPEQFTRIANGSFVTDTSGWSVASGINAAGTSITRVTTEGPGDDTTCARLVTPATDDAGCNYDLGTERYFADADHSTVVLLRLWLKRESGGRRASVVIGSEGTSTSRATLAVDLRDDWQSYELAWRPQTTVTDVQVAVMTGDDQAVTLLLGGVSLHSPLASQVDNGSFLTDTTGWIIDGSLIADAATSLTRMSSAGIAGLGAELTGDGTADSGADISLGGRLFTSGRTYRLRLALRAISGTDQVRLRLGSVGTPADRADSTVTAAAEAWHTLDWTPTADRTDAAVSVASGAASAMLVRLSEVEVYESADDLTPDRWETSRGAAFDGTDVAGTMSGELPDLDATYTPWQSASDLYGSVRAGVPVMARATYGSIARGLGWGRLSAVEPDPYREHAHVTTDDGLRDLARVKVARAFTSTLSVADARDAALTAAGLGAWQRDLDTGGPEAGTLFDGTDEAVYALSYLSDLNSATGSIHVAVPSPHANVGWVYTTHNRAAMTDTGSHWSITDDTRGPLAGATMRDDTLVTAVRRNWRGYELMTVPDIPGTVSLPWGDETPSLPGAGVLAIGGDPATYATLTPYLAPTREAFASFSEPATEDVITMRVVKGRRKRKRRARWTDPVFPLTVSAGTTHTLEMEWSVPMENVEAEYMPSSADVTVESDPARTTVTIAAGAADVTITGLALVGRPWLPTDEGSEEVSTASLGTREPQTGSDTYVSGPGAAAGLARYMTWRYSTSRLRPVIKDALKPSRMLHIEVGQVITLTVAKYDIDAMRCVVTNVGHDIARPESQAWVTHYALEQLPADAGPWVRIGGGADYGIGSSARLAP